jgi:NHS family xanthosine MFS transporter
MIKFRLTILGFFQFFVWGAWLITIGVYCLDTKGYSGNQFGAIFSTLALSSLFMPALTGYLADRFINAERLYGILQILYGLILLYVPYVESPDVLFYVIFGAMICYMPTISLSNTISYAVLKSNGMDVVNAFPPIRVWGTVGFILAMWVTNLTGSKANSNQFIIAAVAAISLGAYAFTLPECKPTGREKTSNNEGVFSMFSLLLKPGMGLFFMFSMLLGAALQLSNMYGDIFLVDFKNIPQYSDSFVVKYSTIVLSISQISETLFILTIPFFLKRFGIKQVMLMSMLAYVLRFGLFSFGDPAGGLWMILLSCVVYGMAFDFFNISGSLYVENVVDAPNRASAQGLFMMMTNGVGAFLGSTISGKVIDAFYTLPDQSKDWNGIWLAFAGYALVVAILFGVLFKEPKTERNLSH